MLAEAQPRFRFHLRGHFRRHGVGDEAHVTHPRIRRLKSVRVQPALHQPLRIALRLPPKDGVQPVVPPGDLR